MEIAWNDFCEAALKRQIDDMANDPERRKQEAQDRAVVEQCRVERERNKAHRTLNHRHGLTGGSGQSFV